MLSWYHRWFVPTLFTFYLLIFILIVTLGTFPWYIIFLGTIFQKSFLSCRGIPIESIFNFFLRSIFDLIFNKFLWIFIQYSMCFDIFNLFCFLIKFLLFFTFPFSFLFFLPIKQVIYFSFDRLRLFIYLGFPCIFFHFFFFMNSLSHLLFF